MGNFHKPVYGQIQDDTNRTQTPKMSVRSFIATGDLPSPQDDHIRCPENDRLFERVLCRTPESMCRRIIDRFNTDAPTDWGAGSYYIHALLGGSHSGARETVYAVAQHQGIRILDLTTITPKALQALTIRELGQYILDTSPRCAIIVSLLDNRTETRLGKVLKWLAKQQLDLGFRRVLFCLTTDLEHFPLDTTTQNEHFPGCTDDKLQMMLLRIPPAFTTDIVRLQPIAEAMDDYAVFEPRIWSNVDTNSTLDAFFSTLTFQVHRRSRTTSMNMDTTLDPFPTFEAGWRRTFSDDLQTKLIPVPETTCRGIHRVLPAGVSPTDALKSIQTALPTSLTTDPYALTVASEAVDDRCGAINVTQRTQHVVVQIQCCVDPAIVSQVCKELRTGHRLIAQELSTTNAKLTSLQTKMESEIDILKDLIVGQNKRPSAEIERRQCSKTSCINLVVDQFANGRWKNQCTGCIGASNKSRKTKKQEWSIDKSKAAV